MPVKRKMKRRPRYRRYRRRRNLYKALTAPIPTTKIVKMKYAECFSIDPVGAGGVASYVFRANGIQDPNYSGTGHQPLGHDEWANFYKKYRVLGAKATLVAMSNSATSSGQHIVSMFTSYDPIVSLTYDTTTMERAGTVWKTLGALGASNGTAKLVKYWSAKKSFGKGWNDDDCGASFGALPTREWYFLVTTQSPSTGADPVAISCVMELEFIVQLTDPLELPQS